MPKYIITFGQEHRHEIDGKVFDRNCVAEVEAENELEARNLFMPEFCFSYPEESFSENNMSFFPRGKISIKAKTGE